MIPTISPKDKGGSSSGLCPSPCGAAASRSIDQRSSTPFSMSCGRAAPGEPCPMISPMGKPSTYNIFRQWVIHGAWQAGHDGLRELVRKAAGKKRTHGGDHRQSVGKNDGSRRQRRPSPDLLLTPPRQTPPGGRFRPPRSVPLNMLEWEGTRRVMPRRQARKNLSTRGATSSGR
mgnify:FL=1